MTWRTDKPTKKVIVAKLTEDFCHLKDSYAILRLVNEPYQHYSEDGEEVPYAAIEKWASLEEEPISNAEFAERAKKWILNNLFFFCYGDKDQLKKFKDSIADIIVSSQGLCTYDACKDVAEREATFLISMLLPEPNIQSSNIIETIRAEIERRYVEYSAKALSIIKSLQQEQPEVELEKEVDERWDEFVSSEGEREDFTRIARHFTEWGAEHSK